MLCWSRFVPGILISLFASRFPADHRTKNDWLHVLKLNQEAKKDSYQLFGTRHALNFQSSPHVFTNFHVQSTSFQHVEGARRLVELRDYIEEAAQKLTRDRGKRFPSPRKASMVVWCFCLLATECLMSASAALLLMLCCAGALVLARSTQQKAAQNNYIIGVST